MRYQEIKNIREMSVPPEAAAVATKMIDNPSLEGKLLQWVTGSQAGWALVKRIGGGLVFGLGAAYDLYLAWQYWKEGDWESALAQVTAAGLNVAQISGLISGGAGTLASMTAQVMAMIYPLRWDLWSVYADLDPRFAHEPNKSDPKDQSLADEIAVRMSKVIGKVIWDGITGIGSWIAKYLPGSAMASTTAKTAEPQTATGTPVKKTPWLPPSVKQPWLPPLVKTH